MRKKYKTASAKPASWLLVVTVVFLLYGCPYSSAFKIDSDPSIPVEETLFGKWATASSDAYGNTHLIKMIINKKDDYEYNIDFTGNINSLKRYINIKDDTIKTTAFVSEAASRRFLNIHLFEQYYIVEFIYRDDKLTLLPLCEHFTSKLIKSDAEIRPSLEQHFKTRLYPLYDDEFCLKEMIRVK